MIIFYPKHPYSISLPTKRIALKKTTLLFILVFLFSFPVLASNDTTYGPTRLAPRAPQSNETRKGSTGTSAAKSENTASNHQGFLESCICSHDSLKTMKDAGIAVLLFPFKVIVCTTIYGLGMGFWESNKYLIGGNPTNGEWYARKIHAGASLGLGGIYLPKMSAGLQANAAAELYLTLNNRWALRERMGVFGSANVPTGNVERDVFVNSQRIGVDHFTLRHYGNSAYSFFTEAIIAPFSGNGAFYIVLGAGPLFQMERTWYQKTSTYNNATTITNDNESQLVTGFTLGIGRFISLGKLFGTYEIRYQGIINKNNHQKPIPSDNASMSHALQLNWSLMF
jgi:hypothetical protein